MVFGLSKLGPEGKKKATGKVRHRGLSLCVCAIGSMDGFLPPEPFFFLHGFGSGTLRVGKNMFFVCRLGLKRI